MIGQEDILAPAEHSLPPSKLLSSPSKQQIPASVGQSPQPPSSHSLTMPSHPLQPISTPSSTPFGGANQVIDKSPAQFQSTINSTPASNVPGGTTSDTSSMFAPPQSYLHSMNQILHSYTPANSSQMKPTVTQSAPPKSHASGPIRSNSVGKSSTRSKPYLPPPINPAHAPSHNSVQISQQNHVFAVPAPVIRRRRGLPSNYRNRIRDENNGLLIPLVSSKEEDVELEISDTDSEPEVVSRRSTRANPPPTTQSSQAAAVQPTKPKKYIKTNHVHYPKATIRKAAEIPETLVPIKLEVDLDGYKLKDSITWNLKDNLITPEKFAEIMCVDMDLSVSKFGPIIALSIRQQLEEYAASVGEIGSIVADGEDARIVINLDLQLGRIQFRDRFEWDLTSSLTPEEFAKVICADLNISGEFHSAIATAIREQILKYTKDRLYSGEDMSFLTDNYGRNRRRGQFGPNEVRDLNYGVFRLGPEVNEWSPFIEVMTTEELEKSLVEKERESRRMRRESGRVSILNKQRLNEIQRIILQNQKVGLEQERHFMGTAVLPHPANNQAVPSAQHQPPIQNANIAPDTVKNYTMSTPQNGPPPIHKYHIGPSSRMNDALLSLDRYLRY
ncbi:hypothetical protein BKA69DRAFT_1035133 [Paraphysoderma sedebokerense]|nr:hypothetical protein BKA69DRAFT_1035133 [Paraphysoderma sedebokerense]